MTAARTAGAAAVGKEIDTIITEQYNGNYHSTGKQAYVICGERNVSLGFTFNLDQIQISFTIQTRQAERWEFEQIKEI